MRLIAPQTIRGAKIAASPLLQHSRLIGLRMAHSMTSAAQKVNGHQETHIPAFTSLAISESEDDAEIRKKYRPFILTAQQQAEDWANRLELDTVLDMAEKDLELTQKRLKVLVLYGSLRKRYLCHLSPRVLPSDEVVQHNRSRLVANTVHRSYSKLVAFEACRILFRLGCDVRVFNPEGLPVKNDVEHAHPKVKELRELSTWSDGHLWVTPEQHGNLVCHFIISLASVPSS